MTSYDTVVTDRSADLEADHRGNRRLTRTLVLVTLGVSFLVCAVMGGLLALSWQEMSASGDPLAGVAILVALVVCTPFAAGAVVALLAVPFASRRGGPAVAGVGLAIDAVAGVLLLLGGGSLLLV